MPSMILIIAAGRLLICHILLDKKCYSTFEIEQCMQCYVKYGDQYKIIIDSFK